MDCTKLQQKIIDKYWQHNVCNAVNTSTFCSSMNRPLFKVVLNQTEVVLFEIKVFLSYCREKAY